MENLNFFNTLHIIKTKNYNIANHSLFELLLKMLIPIHFTYLIFLLSSYRFCITFYIYFVSYNVELNPIFTNTT